MSRLSVAVLCAAALGSQTGINKTEVLVIERSGTSLTYHLRDRQLDTRQPLTGIRQVLGEFRPDETRMFVLIGEGVPLDEAYLVASVLGKIGSFENVRYFHFSRRSGAMVEFTLGSERWRLSFDGNLVKSNR